MNKAVFLDRDGTIIHDFGYNYKKEHLVFLDGSFEALLIFKSLGYKLILITNQSGIGRGYFSLGDYENFNRLFLDELERHGIAIDDVLHCPHAKEDKCNCRKPKTGLIDLARLKHNIDLSRSIFIGDKDSDILCGQAIGCDTVRIRGQYKIIVESNYTFDSIYEFALGLKGGL